MSDVSGETGKETSEGFPEITDNFSVYTSFPIGKNYPIQPRVPWYLLPERCLRQILRKSWIVISVQIIQGFSIFSAVASRIEFLPSLVFRGTID